MALMEKQESRKELDELMAKGFILPSSSTWKALILFMKKNDKSFKLCIDYHHVNKLNINNKYPLPRIDDLLDHQLWFIESDIPKITFPIRYEHFEFVLCHSV